MSIKYRPEIDGLRAIAVIPVILFHAGFELFQGGFVGVDIFFVISGYLITSIILSDLSSSKFSFSRFYERRIKRLYPPLFLMIILCVAPAFLLLFPPDLIDFFQSTLFVTLFSSNFLFWLESGYFETASELKPLLHTWSLAIEEQFYLFFPFLIVFGYRKNLKIKTFITLTIFTIILSLSLAQYSSSNHPSANFFLLPSRIWELLFGSLIAFIRYKNEKVIESKSLNNFLSFFGLFLIFYSILSFNEKTPYPSLYTLVPILGTSLIVLANDNKNLIHKILKVKPLVLVGLISYGAYLYHQPVFVFFKHYQVFYYSEFVSNHSTAVSVFLILIVFVLSYLSWKYFETPLRYKRVGRSFLFKFTFGVSISLLSISYLLQREDVLLSFIGKNEYSSFLKNPHNKNKCFINSKRNWDKEKILKSCLNIKKDVPNILVLGDSFSNHLMFGFKKNLKEYNFMQLSASGCVPFDFITTNNIKCDAPFKFIQENYLPKHDNLIDLIVLAFRDWGALTSPDLLKSGVNKYKRHAKNVLIIGPSLEFKTKLPYILMKGVGTRGQISKNHHLVKQDIFKINTEFKGSFSESVYLDMLELVCSGSNCKTLTKSKKPIWWDYGHFSNEGSVYIVEKIKEKIESILEKK